MEFDVVLTYKACGATIPSTIEAFIVVSSRAKRADRLFLSIQIQIGERTAASSVSAINLPKTMLTDIKTKMLNLKVKRR